MVSLKVFGFIFKVSSIFLINVEKATSLTNLEPDWTSIMQICDAIRQNDVQYVGFIFYLEIKIFFLDCTDTFGRVIVYKFELYGQRSENKESQHD